MRDEGEQIALNSLLQAVRASGSFDFFTWRIDTRNPQVRICGRIHAPASAFVGLSYQNPPGGEKTCLNTKLASAEITVQRRGRPSRTLVTRHRAAFEILTDRVGHGVPIVVRGGQRALTTHSTGAEIACLSFAGLDACLDASRPVNSGVRRFSGATFMAEQS